MKKWGRREKKRRGKKRIKKAERKVRGYRWGKTFKTRWAGGRYRESNKRERKR